MRYLSPILSLLLKSCNSAEQTKEELLRTEKAFSETSVKKGMKEAFLCYAADDVVKLRNKKHPILGWPMLKESFEAEKEDSGVLKWYPVKAEAAMSGELGYTYGNWEYTTKDSTGADVKVYGNYVTIWKKDSNGKWKFTLDGGNTTPPPIN